jgi:hypothetical protein
MAGPSTPPLPPPFAAAALAMPPLLRALLVDNVSPDTIDAAALSAQLDALPLGLPAGGKTDAMAVAGLLDPAQCAALRDAVDGRHEHELDTVDGADDLQLNLSADELAALVGAEAVASIHGVAHALDVQRGGSGARELPLVEAFVRRYCPDSRPWHPLHQDRAAVTVNVALSADAAHRGGRLVGVFADGARHFARAEGDATVHLSRIVHGVTRMTAGVRYALIVFLGHEPAVRRAIGADGEWTRVVLEP